MLILGGKLKEIRKEKKLSQKELAKDICTQVTISKIERHNRVPTIKILSDICTRLDIKLNDVLLFEGESNVNYDLLQEIKKYCDNNQFEKAFQVMSHLSEKKMTNTYEKKLLNYYQGFLFLYHKKDVQEAQYYLNLSLTINKDSLIFDFLDCQILNMLGYSFFVSDELDRANIYYEKSVANIEQLADLELLDIEVILKIYYNSAKFYSDIENFQQAILLCDKGISLSKEINQLNALYRFYYEKAFNLAKIKNNREAENHYFIAMGLVKLLGNELVSEIIKENLKKFQLELRYND
ncbi:hypothetical protein CKN73_09570 [Carnobacterium divergens]|uniref:helix-turn-helix domain-containing protein n=1 Tax=Carnobacterium divergens TaxID=2748 RepID=UPI001071C520|nr:helix-turn-helix domain-containing protein [Carnobacterium divergens]MDT2012193.1 helix-turn-helix domain-containing protein [Carnobacterium divergens]TFJ39745.1 hypothetical protein CKN77_09670 [Carnobacterium divergens]TFJ48722.1 hypothetical protein CKN73_09570 [Carnobacterium divergens]TFJ53482.1 hypothetical protein CKN83_09475 [Carnobacterium divergens]TFJ59006.1 hypothetical protein CKN89_09915 [Carnobacterium divergens]